MYYITIQNSNTIIKLNKPILLSAFIKTYIYKLHNLCIAAIINNEIQDINYLINRSLNLQLILINDITSLNIIRKSCAFLCAYAIQKLWHDKKDISIYINEYGFLYDLNLNYRINSNDLKKIQNLMLILLKQNNLKIKTTYFTKTNIFKILNKNYKNNSIYNLDNNKYKYFIKIYNIENYWSFNLYCVIQNIKYYKHFNLQDISGVHCNNKIIQRIKAIVFKKHTELKNYYMIYNKILKRDHRKINKILDLYHIEKDSPGLVFWHVNGLILLNKLKFFINNKLFYLNYKEIQTPVILNKNLWYKTGHLTYYKNYMFDINNTKIKFCMKPMNCPAHVKIYKQSIKSYKDLPYKLSEFGNCFRNESSGSLHGLLRLKNFTQDDAHIFCTFNQLKQIINECINLLYEVYTSLGFKNILVKLSTRPMNRLGNDKNWDKAELSLSNILINNNIQFNYQLNSGAFYGPKIEFILNDSLNRQWQCGTLQIDLTLAQKLNVFYIDKNNNRKHPIIIHRAILGSLERFIGILIEEYDGYLPIWLAPIQVIVININNKQEIYAKNIHNILLQSKIRSYLDLRNVNISLKIRDHLKNKIKYIIICGEKENMYNKISFRKKNLYTVNLIDIHNFIDYFLNKILLI